LPHARLKSILETATGDEVTLTRDGAACIVNVGRGEWRLPVEDAAEFPTWETGKLKSLPRIPCDQFARAVRSVVYACDNESSRFALGAVLVDVVDGNPTLVATDGRRLSSVACETDQAVDDSQTLVPRRAMTLIAEAAAGSDGSVQLLRTHSELVAEVQGATITARRAEGRFPKWSDVFPEREVEAHAIERAALSSATRAASICTSEQSKSVAYQFGSTLKLSSQSPEAGQAHVICDIARPGKPTTVRLDPRFVIDFLDGLDKEDEPHVEIEVEDASSAVVLRCGDVRGVIMPMADEA
ncbi:MAG: hypothetical protein EBR82_86165, partial [Caulobacteraceae bacterium]|nr:hypothetical protein [Caulobacteraceae bacterium]